VQWPEWQGVPQSFIAQIRLEEVYAYDIDGLLPPKGMLWFFYDAQQKTFGENPSDAGGWQVFFVEDVKGLQRASAPQNLPAKSQFHAQSVQFSNEVTLAQDPKTELSGCDWTDAEVKSYETLLSNFPDAADHASTHHRMLGYADTIQDDMRVQCQLVSHGIKDTNDPRAKDLLPGARDWHLLLQVDSDESVGMQWASTGMLYYWIAQTDLQAHHFEHSWLVLQSD
jgi:uncharacterized protein YwqG